MEPMSMKRLMMVAALAVAQSGCVSAQDDAALTFSNALALAGAPGGSCEPDTSKFIGQGSLDVSGGGNYLLFMRVQSSIPTPRIISIGDTPTTVGGENIILNEFVYRYESSPDIGLPEEDSVVTYAVVPPGASGASYLPMNAFGPKALARLNEPGVVPAFPGVSILTYIKARGRVGSTSNAESNEFAFPVQVYASGGSCLPGDVPTGGICSPGQDEPLCEPAPTP
jgi:hypothetical protein